MKKLLLCLLAVAAYGTDCVISDTVRTPFGGYFSGKISVTLNAPASSQPLYSGSQTLTGWQTTIDVPASANGAVAVTLVCTDSITPSGTSYAARYQPTSGSGWAEVWTPATGTTTIRAMRATTVPTPTVTFQPGQIAPGTNGQVLTTTGGATAWGSAGGVTSIAGTANQITASASTGAVTLSLPATITGLTSVTSTNFVGTVTAASALASTVASGRVWYGNGTGAPGSASTFVYDAANGRLGVGTNAPSYAITISKSGSDVSGNYAALELKLTGAGSFGPALLLDATSATGGKKYTLFSGAPSEPGGAGGFGIYDNSGGATRLLIPTTGNLLIGGTTDGNYRLDVQTKGSTGVARFWDQTSTTGSTLVVVQAGQGQSGNLLSVRNNAGTEMFGVDSSGRAVLASGGVTLTWSGNGGYGNAGPILTGGPLSLPDNTVVGGMTRAADLGFARNAAGVLEINNGTAGTYRDLKLRSLQWTTNTEATCNASVRGTVTMVQGGSGVADTLRVCRKDAADAYAWTALY